MGYKKLIQNSVKAAFKAIGDLVIPLEFLSSSEVTFDFATNSSSTQTYTSKSISGVLIANKKVRSKENGAVTLKNYILFDTAALPDLTGYDKVVINNITWNLSFDNYTNDGFLTTIEVVRS